MDSTVLFFCIVLMSQSYGIIKASAKQLESDVRVLERDPRKAYTADRLLQRVKRQARKKEDAEIDWGRIDRSLYGWRPTTGSPSCPQGHYLCRDRSYCFESRSLCNNLVSCDDQSDEINEVCGYTTTQPQPTTTTIKDGTPKPGITTGPTVNNEAKFQRNRFNDPLVIAFLVFVIAMLIYVVSATAWCIKYRMNSVRPRMEGGSGRSLQTVKSQQHSNHRSENPELQHKIASDGNGTQRLANAGDPETKLSE